jgi:LysR family transcriptional regulator for bpeEF and oprC
VDQLLAMRVFVRVAERGSFARAADELDISRAAASGHVAALEKHLGVRLLHRTTRKVSLTAEGSDFLRRSRRILDELRDAEESLHDARTKPQGQLRVDVPVAFGRYLLLPALPRFTSRYPAIELDIRLNDRIVDLVAERVDVAVRAGPLRQSGLVARRIAEMTMVTCAAPSYLESHGIPATPDDLRAHRLLGLRSSSGAPPEWHFPPPYSPRRLKLHFALTFNTVEGPIVAATEGLGICQAADLLVAEYFAHGTLQLILQEHSMPGPSISLVYPSAGHQSARVRVFSDFAAELMRSYSDMVRANLRTHPGAEGTRSPHPAKDDHARRRGRAADSGA